MLVLLGLAMPGRALAARTVQPHPSGIIIHLFSTGTTGGALGTTELPSGTTVPKQPGITVTTSKGIAPVSFGFAKALAEMLNDSGTPSGLSGRQANLPPQSISPDQRHPAP